MQDDAVKTPETPRWFGTGYNADHLTTETGHYVYTPTQSVEDSHRVKHRLEHLEAALREAEKDIAFIHEQHDEEAVRVYTQIFGLNAKLREAEAKAELADEILDGEGPRDYTAAETWETTSVYCPWCGEFIEGHMPMPDFKHMEGCVYARWDALQQPKAGQ